MPTDDSAKLHGDKLEESEDHARQPSNMPARDKMEIPSPQEHPTSASVKIHGDKLDETNEEQR